MILVLWVFEEGRVLRGFYCFLFRFALRDEEEAEASEGVVMFVDVLFV